MALPTQRFLTAMVATSFLLPFVTCMRVNAADGPNRITSSDAAAGRWMDSLLNSKSQKLQQSRANRIRPTRSLSQQRPSLQGKLVKNTSTRDGSPLYALVNRQGKILRYVEPVKSIDLRQYLGQTVTVRRDTGKILLASQLALPRSRAGRRSVDRSLSLPPFESVQRAGKLGQSNGFKTYGKNSLRRAQHEEPLAAGEPTPADALAEELPGATPEPEADSVADADELTLEAVEAGPIDEAGPAYIEGSYEGSYEDSYEGAYEGEYYSEDESIVDGYDDGNGIDFGGCTTCGSSVCRAFGGCGRGSRGRGYLRGESLSWWFSGMDSPPLVTQSNLADGGVLPNPGVPGDNPSTVILFGGKNLLDDPRAGGRITFGIWLDDAGKQALEFDYLRFDTETQIFSAYGEDGNPTLSRPFFDLFTGLAGDGHSLLPPAEAAEQVSSDTLDGRVTVRIKSDFESFGIRFRHNLCCCSTCTDDCGDSCGVGVGCGSGVGGGGVTRRIDLLAGFRYARLDESLHIREDLTVDTNDATNPDPGLPPHGTRFIVQDWFETDNEFLGGELGFLWEIENRRWSFEMLSKLAIGNNRQRVRINGSTQVITDPPTVPTPDLSAGGLLAQTSNIGTYERDEFSVLPEVGFTLGYQATPRFKILAGYTLLYWSNVVRPGNQIDREINTTLIPDFDTDGTPIPAGTLVGPLRPSFEFQDTNIWAQGVNFGGEYRW